MSKKIIFYATIIVLIIVNVLVDINIDNYVDIINRCFNKSIILTNFHYTIICFIIAFISILFVVVIKLVVFYKKEEIKGVKLKSEDHTYRLVKLVGR